jgi:hypothetical protein
MKNLLLLIIVIFFMGCYTSQLTTQGKQPYRVATQGQIKDLDGNKVSFTDGRIYTMNKCVSSVRVFQDVYYTGNINVPAQVYPNKEYVILTKYNNSCMHYFVYTVEQAKTLDVLGWEPNGKMHKDSL